MQIVKPIDIGYALSEDLGEYVAAECVPSPAPDDMEPPMVCAMPTGGTEQTAVSHEYSVRLDCYALTYSDAIELANEAAGVVASLPLRNPQSGRSYATASINATPYENPDPLRPQIPRVSLRAEVGVRGVAVRF